jgi:hypothetical protein
MAIIRSYKNAPAAQATASAFTFPKNLVHLPKSQAAQYADLVAQKISDLDTFAAQLGGAFGIAFTTFELVSASELPKIQDEGLQLAVALLQEMSRRPERVVLERREQQWGLFYTREAPMLQPNERKHTVRLREASLDARLRFLNVSEEFFGQYLALCQERFGGLKDALTAGDHTLAMLRSLKFE